LKLLSEAEVHGYAGLLGALDGLLGLVQTPGERASRRAASAKRAAGGLRHLDAADGFMIQDHRTALEPSHGRCRSISWREEEA
jgi:hypothetical protein